MVEACCWVLMQRMWEVVKVGLEAEGGEIVTREVEGRGYHRSTLLAVEIGERHCFRPGL